MADKTLLQLPNLTSPTTGAKTYLVDGTTSYQGTIDAMARLMISSYNIPSSLANTPQIYVGSGTPEGRVTAVSGSIYTDWYNRYFYQKVTGVGAFGWI